MATLYASAYLVATPKGYTKHYYAGNDRIASKIGGGGLRDIKSPIGNWQEKQEQWRDPYKKLWMNCLTSLEPEIPRVINSESEKVKLYKLHDYTTVQNTETELYFYHPDHLGSAAWITDKNGKAIQHLQYLPFGEPRIDQRTTSWNTMFTFSGKERDEESSYSYFGARYYNSDLSIWLSVDPRASSYPSLTPYNYCMNSPVMYTDPNGEWVQFVFGAIVGAFQGLQMGKAMGASGWAMAGYILGGAAIGAATAGIGTGLSTAIATSATTAIGAIAGNIATGMICGAISTASYIGLTAAISNPYKEGDLLKLLKNVGIGALAGGIGAGASTMIGGELGAIAGGMAAGVVSAACNHAEPLDILMAGVFGATLSIAGYELQMASSYAQYTRNGSQPFGKLTYGGFSKLNTAIQRSFAWGREVGGWILDNGNVGDLAYGSFAKHHVDLSNVPNNAKYEFHTHYINDSERAYLQHSPADLEAIYPSFVITRGTIYSYDPGSTYNTSNPWVPMTTGFNQRHYENFIYNTNHVIPFSNNNFSPLRYAIYKY
jgi:RHS repeat-associated protein